MSKRRYKSFETDLGTNVETPTLPVSLSSHLRSELAISIERDVLDDEETLLNHCVKSERTGASVLITPDCQRENASF